jgi:CIC family chloride channel protein
VLARLRTRLAGADALPLLAALGLASGLLAGGVIILFRFAIEGMQAGFLPGGEPENYEALSATARFLIPSFGGLFIGLVFQYLGGGAQVGVVHVLERLIYNQGYLPWRNMLLQFFGAALSIVSGHSVGREGPGIHLGAASGSLLGQGLHLPNNSIQTLVACGAAASIAASFNTPMAGVIFAMEVIMMEYTIAGFTPIILATVSATALTHLVYGPDPAFAVPSLQLASLWELPYMLVLGAVMGALAAAFITLLQKTTTWSQTLPLWLRMTLAGLLTGLCALAVPEIMGIGYDTVNQALLGQLGLGLLLAIVVFKLAATAVGLGLGLPGGLIGPTLVMGAAAGSLLGMGADSLFPGQVASPGFYAMLGMGAMMGATLQAPLAALVALLELTANPNIILPGMLAIILSGLISSHLFGRDPVFRMLLRARGLDYRSDPVAQSLRRVGVASALNKAFVQAPREVAAETARSLLQQEPRWILVEEADKPVSLLLAADVARHLGAHEEEETLDLMAIPAERQDIAPIEFRATLQQALEHMDQNNIDALYVLPARGVKRPGIAGIITRHIVESYYH